MATVVPQQKTLTLTIIPQTHAKTAEPQVPQFQYTPEVPLVREVRGPLKDLTVDEREQYRLRKQRERKAKYDQKVKNYTKLAHLPSNRDKIVGMMLLCYPQLNTMDPDELNIKVGAFINTLVPR